MVSPSLARLAIPDLIALLHIVRAGIARLRDEFTGGDDDVLTLQTELRRREGLVR